MNSAQREIPLNFLQSRTSDHTGIGSKRTCQTFRLDCLPVARPPGMVICKMVVHYATLSIAKSPRVRANLLSIGACKLLISPTSGCPIPNSRTTDIRKPVASNATTPPLQKAGILSQLSRAIELATFLFHPSINVSHATLTNANRLPLSLADDVSTVMTITTTMHRGINSS